MKVHGFWYGVELEPESQEDIRLLNQLLLALKDDPNVYWKKLRRQWSQGENKLILPDVLAIDNGER